MTTLNTIIEEEKKGADDTIHRIIIGVGIGETDYNTAKQEFDTVLATAMQRAYEAGRDERDTYWKERVREEIEEMASKTVWNAEGKPHISAPDLLQALDNLK